MLCYEKMYEIVSLFYTCVDKVPNTSNSQQELITSYHLSINIKQTFVVFFHLVDDQVSQNTLFENLTLTTLLYLGQVL